MGSWNVVGELVIGYVAEWTHTPFVQVSTANSSFLPPLPFRRRGGSVARTLPPRHAAERTKDRPQHARPAAALCRKGRSSHTLLFVCTCVRVQPLDANLIMTQTDSVSEAPGIPPKNRSNAQRMCVRLLVHISRATLRATFCYREFSPASRVHMS
eukprot:COSAG06_NODE_1719_length_8590_cov_18.960311_4_plen_155_part_00